jgi:3-oxoacyl-(acyl-carrier-protein) synthase
MMNKHRVVVTGMSVLTPIGLNLPTFWENAKRGLSGVKFIDWFDIPDKMSKIAGIIEDFEPQTRSTFIGSHTMADRALLLALETINNALTHANLKKSDLHALTSAKYSICMSSAAAQLGSMERSFCSETNKGAEYLKPMLQVSREGYKTFLFNNLTHQLRKNFSFINGKNVLIPTGCTGGIDAIAYAMREIQYGKSDAVITGATEAPITPAVVGAFSRIGATSTQFNHAPTKASRPFDVQRDGFVLGEGCGILILESFEHAKKRGAKIYAELIGAGSVNNAIHMTDIPEDGKDIIRSCKLAIKDADINPEEIDFINAHGSSTPQNDIAEANAYRAIFGERTHQIPVTSLKSLVGHALAASSAVEIISIIMSINHGVIPPTINLENQDEKCNLNVVGNKARLAAVNCALKTSSGFSGIHTSLIVKRFKE